MFVLKNSYVSKKYQKNLKQTNKSLTVTNISMRVSKIHKTKEKTKNNDD